jgi:hypothetical protein
VKKVIQEVIFPLYDGWRAEAYAWAKELTRQLGVSFHVLRFDVLDPGNEPVPLRQVLEGDGYYFAHYGDSPPKTKVIHLPGDVSTQLLHYLNKQSSVVVVMPNSVLQSALYQSLMKVKGLTLITFPPDFHKTNDIFEFNSVLRQVAFHHLPPGLFQKDSFSFQGRQFLHAFI